MVMLTVSLERVVTVSWWLVTRMALKVAGSPQTQGGDAHAGTGTRRVRVTPKMSLKWQEVTLTIVVFFSLAPMHHLRVSVARTQLQAGGWSIGVLSTRTIMTRIIMTTMTLIDVMAMMTLITAIIVIMVHVMAIKIIIGMMIDFIIIILMKTLIAVEHTIVLVPAERAAPRAEKAR